MKIRFNGIVEQRRSGCNCSKKVTDKGLTTIKSYILPSGTTRVFRRGRVEEISDTDGAFLLNYQYTLNGETHKAFEVVNG